VQAGLQEPIGCRSASSCPPGVPSGPGSDGTGVESVDCA
jgi:hypothetical protein